MQERRILGYYIDKDAIPNSALELTPSMIYNKEPHNTYYLPLYGYDNYAGGAKGYNYPYISLNNGLSSCAPNFYTTMKQATALIILGRTINGFVPFKSGLSYYISITSDGSTFISNNGASNKPELALTPLYVSDGNYYYASPIYPNAYIKVQFKYPVYIACSGGITSGIDVNSNGSIWTYPIYVDDEEVI